jgi:polar amino acid transport system permease protein
VSTSTFSRSTPPPTQALTSDELDDELATNPVVAHARPGRWVATLVVLVVLAQFVYGLFHNQVYEWHKFGRFFTSEAILDGLVVTIKVVLWSGLFGLIGGITVAIGRLSSNPLISGLSWLYVWFFRALPLPLLLIIVYNVHYFLPEIGIGIPFGPTVHSWQTVNISSLAVGIFALSLNEASYAAEVIRGGILSVDHGQVEAANALGLSRYRQLRRVILPQALRSIIPAYGNQLVGLVKASSLVYYVSLLDIFGQVFVLESRFPESVVPILIVGAAWYLILTALLSVLQFYVERYFARGALRTQPLTPIQRLRQVGRDRVQRLSGVRLTRRGF